MRNISHASSFWNSRIALSWSSPLYPGLCAARAASLDRAIGRGIRRSQGVGFRGKEKSRSEHGRNGPGRTSIRRSVEAPDVSSGSKSRGMEWGTSSPKHSASRAKSELPSTMARRGSFEHGTGHSRRDDEASAAIRMGSRVFRSTEAKSGERTPRFNDVHKDYQKRVSDRQRSSASKPSSNKPAWEHRDRSELYAPRSVGDSGSSKIIYPSLAHTKTHSLSRSAGSIAKARDATDTHYPNRWPSTEQSEKANGLTRSTKPVNKRIPLSIPYTTPASEFLYGTSVVEAALKSRRVPRRKHYKLYIYTGENRESAGRDAELERLARRSGVEVARVGSDWLPLLDKMSASRPHNGYILEASPLPMLPVISLRGLIEQDGSPGFEVLVDHQSREDAAINGTSNFLQSSTTPGRKPFILFLDSILDPGNLGGIIRTASFLGVTAIGISKNCTAFSPIVLKASAGASENIPLFTVNKPAGFIADSKLAGWKIFAAVAPKSTGPSSISTHDLANPLLEDPCILMIGSEGEGLRQNLKTKADVLLSVRGSGQSHNVDSLNVSVATGILCDAFLRRRITSRAANPAEHLPQKDGDEKVLPDLF